MRFAYDVDTMQLLHVHRVQDILHGLVYLESTASKRVIFEWVDNPNLLDNLTSWELGKLFRNVTGSDAEPSWTLPIVRELIGQRIGEFKPRLVDDAELDVQIASVAQALDKRGCAPYRYMLGAKVPAALSTPAAPLTASKGFTPAQVVQATLRAATRAQELIDLRLPAKSAFDVPWGRNSAGAPATDDATVNNPTDERAIKQENDTMSTPEEVAAAKVAKEAAAAAKKVEAARVKAEKAAAVATEKLAKELTASTAKLAKDAEKAAAEAKKLAAKLPEQNGITRPKVDSLCGKAWAAFDAISQRKGSPASIAEAKVALPEMVEATVRTQYARWRKYYGVTGRVEAPVPVAPPAAPEVPAAPATEPAAG